MYPLACGVLFAPEGRLQVGVGGKKTGKEHSLLLSHIPYHPGITEEAQEWSPGSTC